MFDVMNVFGAFLDTFHNHILGQLLIIVMFISIYYFIFMFNALILHCENRIIELFLLFFL